jgi:hypothetical protein
LRSQNKLAFRINSEYIISDGFRHELSFDPFVENVIEQEVRVVSILKYSDCFKIFPWETYNIAMPFLLLDKLIERVMMLHIGKPIPED